MGAWTTTGGVAAVVVVAAVAWGMGAVSDEDGDPPSEMAVASPPPKSPTPRADVAEDAAVDKRQQAVAAGVRTRSVDLAEPLLSPPHATEETRTTGESGQCVASMYSEPQPTASGEIFDPTQLTAAHKTLPFHTMVEVTNIATGQSVTVRINDRGPYVSGRCLDLSAAAFSAIALPSQGLVHVSWRVVD